jgi:antitoxin ParD1/3/4
MAEAIQVQFAGVLERFIHERVDGAGVYRSAGEYLQDLVRRDFEKEEERKWGWLRDELKAGVEAEESEFVPLDESALLERARTVRGVWADQVEEELLAEVGRLR